MGTPSLHFLASTFWLDSPTLVVYVACEKTDRPPSDELHELSRICLAFESSQYDLLLEFPRMGSISASHDFLFSRLGLLLSGTPCEICYVLLLYLSELLQHCMIFFPTPSIAWVLDLTFVWVPLFSFVIYFSCLIWKLTIWEVLSS